MHPSLRRAAAEFGRRIHSPSRTLLSSRPTPTSPSLHSLASKSKYSHTYGCGECSWRMNYRIPFLLTVIAGQAAFILGIKVDTVLADGSAEGSDVNDSERASINGLHKIEDGSIKSNEHTSKWRIFTDNGRDFFLKGKLDQAEKFFLSALKEAKEGFGERDPHVASACNNLAELYRVKKQFDEAEPLYLEAITILGESFGQEDIRVATALHNLGQFYLMRQNLEKAQKCYEHALKIKSRVLGPVHIDYADTMYHLGTVLYLLGKEKDAEALIQESIRILEENGQGESTTCIRRLRYLAQMYLKFKRPAEAEKTQRKILHIMEVSKGWNTMETVILAEELALNLQAIGNLKEAEELLKRCLQARKTLLPNDHIQIGANMLHIARVAMLHSGHLRKTSIPKAIAELDTAKDLLSDSIRIAQEVLIKLRKRSGNRQKNGTSEATFRQGRVALVILLQSFNALGLVAVTKEELLERKVEHPNVDAKNALSQCISSYKEFEGESLLLDSPEVKVEYLSCLKHLLSLMNCMEDDVTLQEWKDEMKRVEGEIGDYKRNKS